MSKFPYLSTSNRIVVSAPELVICNLLYEISNVRPVVLSFNSTNISDSVYWWSFKILTSPSWDKKLLLSAEDIL